MINDVDLDGNGTMEFEEFLIMMKRSHETRDNQAQELLEAFLVSLFLFSLSFVCNLSIAMQFIIFLGFWRKPRRIYWRQRIKTGIESKVLKVVLKKHYKVLSFRKNKPMANIILFFKDEHIEKVSRKTAAENLFNKLISWASSKELSKIANCIKSDDKWTVLSSFLNEGPILWHSLSCLSNRIFFQSQFLIAHFWKLTLAFMEKPECDLDHGTPRFTGDC